MSDHKRPAAENRPPGDRPGRAAWLLGVARYLARRYRDNNVMALSAALSFNTIFALIPAIVLGLLAARSLGVLEDGKRSLRTFLEASGFAQIAAIPDADSPSEAPSEVSPAPDGVPSEVAGGPAAASQPAELEVINLADKIEEVVASVESKLTFNRIGPIGAALLVWTALGLLMTTERSLNRVFGAPNDRSLLRSMLLYWALLTLGPLVLAVSVYLGQRSLALLHDAFTPAAILTAMFVNLGQVGVGVIALALIYERLPTASVPFRAALIGSIVAVALWLLAKWGFSVYVSQLVLNGNLYGVLGVIPLFLIWLNASWMIFLLGAEMANLAADPGQLRQLHEADPARLGPTDFLAAAVALARRFHAGQPPASCEQLAAALHLRTAATREILDVLERDGCVLRSAETEPRYALARSAERIAVGDVLAMGDPRGRSPSSDGPALRVAESQRAAIAGTMLADLLRAEVGEVGRGSPSGEASAEPEAVQSSERGGGAVFGR